MSKKPVFAALSLLLILSCATLAAPPKIVFFFIGDGMGFEQVLAYPVIYGQNQGTTVLKKCVKSLLWRGICRFLLNLPRNCTDTIYRGLVELSWAKFGMLKCKSKISHRILFSLTCQGSHNCAMSSKL